MRCHLFFSRLVIACTLANKTRKNNLALACFCWLFLGWETKRKQQKQTRIKDRHKIREKVKADWNTEGKKKRDNLKRKWKVWQQNYGGRKCFYFFTENHEGVKKFVLQVFPPGTEGFLWEKVTTSNLQTSKELIINSILFYHTLKLFDVGKRFHSCCS